MVADATASSSSVRLCLQAVRTLLVRCGQSPFPPKVKRTASARGGLGPATAHSGENQEQTARESRAARFGRDAMDLASPGALSARRFPAIGLRGQPRPPAAPVPRQRAAEESENKRRANRGGRESVQARRKSQAPARSPLVDFRRQGL
jgi:hypothetical protein